MIGTDTVPGSKIVADGPTLRFGDGVAGDLGNFLDRRGFESILLVTDAGVDTAGVLKSVISPLSHDLTRYDATTEPGIDDFQNIPAGSFDCVLAVGGGSVLDTAKVLSLLLAHGGSPANYLGEGRVPGPVRPVVAVPTTSGTGSQATQTAVLTHDGVKRGISDEALRPVAAVVDPALTLGLPSEVTARSGFDAFVHALESLLARDHRWVSDRPIAYQGANPISRPLSEQALGLVHGALERATFDGDDREARRRMSLGSHLAGWAFSLAGLGAVHALASAVGGMIGRPHGVCLAASIRAGLAYNRPVRRDRYAEIARTLDLAGPTDGPADAADALVSESVRLADSVGLPTSFADLGLEIDDVDAIVENVLVQTRRLATNPRRVDDSLADTLKETFGG